MTCTRLAFVGLMTLGFAGGCCSSSERCSVWSRMTRPFQRGSSEASMASMGSEGPVLEDCADGMDGMAPPTAGPEMIAPGAIPDLMPPAGPPGVMDSSGSQYSSPPRRLVPRPRAQEMPYSP
ncbi:MAG: hypothetical protein ACJ8FY_06165 [Gemmataceae bacterium]